LELLLNTSITTLSVQKKSANVIRQFKDLGRLHEHSLYRLRRYSNFCL